MVTPSMITKTKLVLAMHSTLYYPKADVVRQIRYSTKFISYTLKLIYKADTEELALAALDDLEKEWGKKYPAAIASSRNNWPQLSTYFKYPSEIRKLIYTTKQRIPSRISIVNYARLQRQRPFSR